MLIHDYNPQPIVLIIDDTPENLALLSDTLFDAGYRVLVATDGLSALEQINYLKPDIILLDVLMPGLNGYETCQRLKNNVKTANIPILFMTALSELNDLLRGFDEGAVDYLVKPIRPPEVLARVEAQLRHVRTMQRAETALNNSPYATLAINKTGQITWLPETGLRWLLDYLQPDLVSNDLALGMLLPKSILTWFKNLLDTPETFEQATFESLKNGIYFSLKAAPCQHTQDYLLLMQKRLGDWDLEFVKNSLGLTFREAEILMWISKGKTNKEMGLILSSSPRTINKHLEHIFEKLGVATRAAAVSRVMQKTNSTGIMTEIA